MSWNTNLRLDCFDDNYSVDHGGGADIDPATLITNDALFSSHGSSQGRYT